MVIRESFGINPECAHIRGGGRCTPEDGLVIMIGEVVPSIRVGFRLICWIKLQEKLDVIGKHDVVLCDRYPSDEVGVL